MKTITKFDQVTNYVKSQVAKGVWKGGDRIPDADALSAELGVSYMTVKNAMAQLARDGLLERIQKKGTFVAASDSSVSNVVILAQAASLTVSRSTYFRMFLEKAIHCVEVNGYQPLLRIGYGEAPEKFLPSIQFPKSLSSHQTAGVITIAGMEPALDQLGIPYVSHMAVPVEGRPNCVIMDYLEMFRLASQILRDRGYNDFVIMDLSPSPSDQYTESRRKLAREKLQAVGGQADRLIEVPYSVDVRFAYSAFKNYWLEGHRPRAIFFADEVVFDVASRAILELGIKVPEELAILTDGVAGVHYHFPIPVSTLEFDASEMASGAWSILQQLMRNQPVKKPLIIKPRLREGLTV